MDGFNFYLANIKNVSKTIASGNLLPANPDQIAADAVFAQINALPAAGAVTLADEAAIVAAQTAFNGLTAAQQALVTNKAALDTAAAELAALKAPAVTKLLFIAPIVPGGDTTVAVQLDGVTTAVDAAKWSVTYDGVALTFNADYLAYVADFATPMNETLQPVVTAV